MKKTILFILLFSLKALAQSVTISPTDQTHLKIENTGTAQLTIIGLASGYFPIGSAGDATINLVSNQNYVAGKSTINFGNYKIQQGEDGVFNTPYFNIYDGSNSILSHGKNDPNLYTIPIYISSENAENLTLRNSTTLANDVLNKMDFNIGDKSVGRIQMKGLSSNTARMGFFTNTGNLNESMSIANNGNVGIGTINPNASLSVTRGGSTDGTAAFFGTTHVSHFNYDIDENTYIRGGKNGSNVYINNTIGLGNVSIGSGTATEKFHVFGNIKASGTVCASNITCSSDLRFKKNIVTLNNSLANLIKINGVRYDLRKEEFPERNFSDKSQIGFIAQDLENIFPEVVFTDTDGYKSVDYARLTPVLVEAIKELTLRNQTLESRLNKIEKMLSSFEGKTENFNSQK